jgi:hypothetical protein
MSLPNPINVTYVSPLISDTFPYVYIVKDTDNIINIDTTHGEVQVILRNIRNSGILQYQPLLSINDGGNNASVNNITIYPSGGDIINDSASFVINTDGGNSVLNISNINQWLTTSSQPSGGGGIAFGGTNYIYVFANGTNTENATELQTAYNLAKTMSPSATNRITIVCGNGYYNFGSTTFVMDTQYIDLVSLDGNRSVIFNSANSLGTISIIANDVFVKGVNVFGKDFLIATNLNLLKVENCEGNGFESFGQNIVVSGTFINCKGGGLSFGGYGVASGTFNNCIGGEGSFGGFGTASGIFIDCIGSNNSFSGGEGLDPLSTTASGTFTNCKGGNGAFGFNGEASGIFTNCIGGFSSFGSLGTASGTFNNCIGDIYSFGESGIMSGTFNNCIGGGGSFVGNLTGQLYYCRLLLGSDTTFPTVSFGGRTYYCVDGYGDTNNQ